MFHRIAFPVLAALLAAAPLVAAAAHANPAENALLGRDPGTKSAYACFVRHYDAAHMVAHPRQNVRNISMFVQSAYDETRTDSIQLGFKFKGVARPIQSSGDCSVIDGEKGLACGIDCDGGLFTVTTQGSSGAIVGTPDPISIFDPKAPDDQPNLLPKGAEFGADDKSFALDRVDLKQCEGLMTDDDKADIFGARAASK